MSVYIKTPVELIAMREAGRIVGQMQEAIRNAIKPGVTTGHLNKLAEDILRKYNTVSPFMHYAHRQGKRPFPASICTCVNDELVHGIPGPRVLQEGDIISVDCGCWYKGFVGDGGFNMGVGKVSPEAQRILDVSQEALRLGIEACCVPGETKNISQSIQRYVEGQGFNVVREYSGHGVGRNMHEEPQIPNWWPQGRQRDRNWKSTPLKPGMVITIEPMIMAGKYDVKELDDDWTVATKDGSLCTFTEHSVAITENGPLILTLP